MRDSMLGGTRVVSQLPHMRRHAVNGPFRTLLDKYFYVGMALLVIAVVVFGFSHTINANLLHPDVPRPWILPVHAAVFSGWLLLFVVQAGLVSAAKVSLHRRLGIYGAIHGTALPLVGLATALIMQHWHDAQHDGARSTGLSLPFNDMLTFATTFGLALYWRRRPDIHRRLMLIATCCLTGAAFARFPLSIVPDNAFYACVDVLVVFGVLRDLILTRRVHAVYRWALPCMIACQAIAQYMMLYTPQIWVTITQNIMQWTA